MSLNGIRFGGRHSQLHFGAVTKSRKIGEAQKKRITESVPYSSVEQDFTALYGQQAYGSRTLVYMFTLTGNDPRVLRRRVHAFEGWLYEPIGRVPLYDDREWGYHYVAVCTGITEEFVTPQIAEITATFSADPFRQPNTSHPAYTPDTGNYPDIDGDGHVTALDAAAIQTAAANIGAGLDPGLTPEQLILCDADHNGEITASDAAIVLQYSAMCGAGKYTDSPAGWAAFLNDYFHLKGGVI